MELFYSKCIEGDSLVLTPEDSQHCVKVLRHRNGDAVKVVDGKGGLYECVINDADSKSVKASVVSAVNLWHTHPYHLSMAVCPTKNNERYEWFAEKAVEIGVDEICPVIGEHSERRVFRTERIGRIAVSAMKQSLKAFLPDIKEPVAVEEFIRAGRPGLKLIAYCFEDESVPRVSLTEAVRTFISSAPNHTKPQITVLIGPEGDFSAFEASLALSEGYIPVHLGESRLRTETAAVLSLAEIYSLFQ